MKKTVAFLLALLCLLQLAACTPAGTGSTGSTGSTAPSGGDALEIVEFEGEYIFKDSVSVLATCWNPHVYQDASNGYPLSFLSSNLYSFVYNDALNPVEGKEPYTGYTIIPELAAAMPVDVTETVRQEKPQYNIPEDATEGFAYKIALNPDAKFSNGKTITAQTYVDSLYRLLDPKLLNPRSNRTWNATVRIAGAKNYANQGLTQFNTLGTTVQSWLDSGNSLDDLYVNVYAINGATAPDGTKWAKVTDDTTLFTGSNGKGATAKTFYEMFFAPGAQMHSDSGSYCGTLKVYEDNYSFDNVGLYASGEYELTLVLQNAVTGFDLIDNLNVLTDPLVDPELYDACLKETDGVWTSTYGTSPETSVGCGPYKLSEYILDKSMRFTRNEYWYGWTDEVHIYQDPDDGKYYRMYQTTEIYTSVVADANTQKEMFFAGQLMTYKLQGEDRGIYRNSEFLYYTPTGDVSFLTLNGNAEAMAQREGAEDFNTETTDLQSLLLTSFRQALSLSLDRELVAETLYPSRSAGYGLIGSLYLANVDDGTSYRDTDAAMQALCDFYGVDTAKYASLEEAVAAITGYDPESAKALFQQAYTEALAAGYITDSNGDSISDQTVTLTYGIVEDKDHNTVDFLNETLAPIVEGTGFAGKLKIVASEPQGDNWFNNVKQGQLDLMIASWDANVLNPYNIPMLYTYSQMSFDAAWFDATAALLTLTVPVDGTDTEVTMSLQQWTDALNGATVTLEDKSYNFGSGIATQDTRLTILAALEREILNTYNYIPLMENADTALLSQQVYYVVEGYDPVMGRGGNRYLRYNYNEEQWNALLAEGKLNY